MKIRIRKNHELRLKAFDLMNELKSNNLTQKEVIDKIYAEFGVPRGTLYSWYANRDYPYGRRGREVTKNPELFYVLGALLGDGCIYYWKKLNRHIINIAGEKEFTEKYADKLSKCTRNRVKNYINRNNNVWFVNIGNLQLYFLFQQIRGDLKVLRNLLAKGDYYKNSLQLIEGFFDAEGCIKIIKEKVRKTPKICPDICCTNYEILELIRKLLQEHLNIEARYSIQKADGIKNKKVAYHLRIYKKEFVRKFFENISTIKLKNEKIAYVENWLNNGL
ncbi:hypothetical protein HYX00_02630 [Candidatus Woesearchaeota archaeon]|nr:hypothetical protein [Candidatus Woesearchaeota archaeon]